MTPKKIEKSKTNVSVICNEQIAGDTLSDSLRANTAGCEAVISIDAHEEFSLPPSWV